VSECGKKSTNKQGIEWRKDRNGVMPLKRRYVTKEGKKRREIRW